MKRVLSFSFLAVALCLTVGCATNQANTTASTANTPITLDEALQKSAETRQKLQEAKAAYQNAKAAAANQSGDATTADLAKQAVQNQLNTAKTQVNTEVQAWKEVLKD